MGLTHGAKEILLAYSARQLETAGSICKTALQAVASPRRGTWQVKPATSVAGHNGFTNSILKTPCYIEAKAAESGLRGASFQGAFP